MRVALVTCSKNPGLYAEEQQLVSIFAKRGIEARAEVWSDATVNWRGYDRVVIRSTWDYFKRFREFRRWLDLVGSQNISLVNPLALIEWNLDKLYLRDLEKVGVPIIPTAFFERGASCNLTALVAQQGWKRAILKPSISGGAYETYLFDANQAGDYQPKADAILAECGVLVQPYFPEIEADGECSLLFFGGKFAFGVLKKPAPKDFRVQFDHGGTFSRFVPDESLINTAQEILTRLPQAPAYARVDGVRRAGKFYLMEVELIEPYLYLAVAPEMAERYVDAIIQAVVD